MKLMIASDLHGSAYYTQALLRRMEDEKPAKLVLLGDILYHGPAQCPPARLRHESVRRRSTRSKKRRFASAATATEKWTRWY